MHRYIHIAYDIFIDVISISSRFRTVVMVAATARCYCYWVRRLICVPTSQQAILGCILVKRAAALVHLMQLLTCPRLMVPMIYYTVEDDPR